MKWTREEYIELMTFGEFKRPMFSELFGPLIGLDREWASQGATEDEIKMKAFDWDYVPLTGCGAITGLLGGYKPQIIEDNAEYRIERDAMGRVTKLCKATATIPLPMEYPVADMDSWLKLKPFFTFNEERVIEKRIEEAVEAQKKGTLVTATIPGGFDFPRELMGEENCCIAYYDDPELMEDIIATACDTSLKVLDRVSDKITIDLVHIHEDMAGKSGPLIGPNLIEEFIKPYYTKVWEMLQSKGTKIFSMDSDGNINPVIDAYMDCGINAMFPMEPAAGMDIVEIRKKYGNKLALKGGIDKHVLRESKDAIRRELEYKLQPMMQESGGIVFALDHRIPNGTPIENYRYYVDTAREILGIPKRTPEVMGWGPMAF